MRPAPGSFFWLVAHDLRLGVLRTRAMFGKRGPVAFFSILVAIVAVFHLLAWPAAAWFVKAEAASASGGMYYPALACAAVFVLPWLVAQALTNSTRALYSRGDLDLLLASPISPRTLLSARALAMAIESLLSTGVFLFPIANMNAIMGGWRWLAVYPALAASALFATGFGLVATVTLFAIMGPARTRLASQILATFIASAFVLGLQLVNVLPDGMRDNIVEAINHPAPGSICDRNSLLWLPVRAAMGEVDCLAIWMAASLAVFFVSAIALGPRFMASAVRSAGVATTAAPASAPAREREFRGGVGASLRRKEWLLLRRDPFLASQLLLQIIYTLPISVVIWRSQGPGGSLALAVSPCIVVISAQISASLAWLAVSSEDAPEFLASAPVTRSYVERRKLEAVFAPLSALMLPPCLALGLSEPGMAALTVLFAIGAAGSTAVLNIWRPHPGRRSDVMRRHQQSRIVGLMEHMLALCWAVAIVLAIMGGWLFLLPLSVVALLLWFNRPAGAPLPALARRDPSRPRMAAG